MKCTNTRIGLNELDRGRGGEWGQKNTRTKFKVGTDSHKQPQRDTYRGGTHPKIKTTSKMKTA